MKKHSLFRTMVCGIIGATLLVLFGCQPQPIDPPADKPNWLAVTMPEYFSSMTMVCLPPQGEKISEADELAAFLDNNCLSVASIEDGIFYLGIPGPEYTTEIEIRYYSATLKTIRVARLAYMPDARIGSTSAPYILQFDAVSAPQRIVLKGGIQTDDAAGGPRRVNIGVVENVGGIHTDYLYWREGDKVRLQKSNGSAAAEMTLVDGANTRHGDFETWSDEFMTRQDPNWYVTYPATATYHSGTTTYHIPAEQSYAAANFANELMPMCSKVEYDSEQDEDVFDMRPVATAVCLQLQGTKAIRSIAIHSAGAAIAGELSTNGVSTTGGSSQDVALICPDVALQSETVTKFYLVLPSVTLNSGSTFTITASDGTQTVKTLQQDIALEHGKTLNFPLLTIE